MKTEGIAPEESKINPVAEPRYGPIGIRLPYLKAEQCGEKLGQALCPPQAGMVNDFIMIVVDEFAAQGIQITPDGQHSHKQSKPQWPKQGGGRTGGGCCHWGLSESGSKAAFLTRLLRAVPEEGSNVLVG